MGNDAGNTEPTVVDISNINAARVGANYLNQTLNGDFSVDQLNHINQYIGYMLDPKNHNLSSHKVGVMMVCINEQYWPYALQVISGLKAFFLPGHDTEIMLWTDMQNNPEAKDVSYGTTVFPVDSVQWPYPTLLRYHLFLAQEEYLKKFDYLFYIDLDMRVVNIVGDEILGDGLTMAQHPMYALKDNLIPPYEPDSRSKAYIPMPGRVVDQGGKKSFQPLYAAGGFQGGTTETFIPAMKTMKEGIDADFDIGYVARWNDESHWNRYLYDHPPSVVLNPSYVYPDSLINEYYIKIWGRNYTPKIITLTKPFTVSKEGGEAAAKMML